MRKQGIKQAFENNSMEVALEALGKSIARWTDKGDQLETAIPGLALWRRDQADPAGERHVRAEPLPDRPRGQTPPARRRHVRV